MHGAGGETSRDGHPIPPTAERAGTAALGHWQFGISAAYIIIPCVHHEGKEERNQFV